MVASGLPGELRVSLAPTVTSMRAVDDPIHPTRVTVGCANFAAVPRDKAATVAKIVAVMGEAADRGCDLVVFPELALNTWGECPDCAAAHAPCAWHLAEAELVPGPATEALAAEASRLDVHVIVGLEERDPHDPGTIYNSAVLIAPEGILGTYRKVHLGIPLETDRFSPGDDLPVFETRLGPIGIQICYDFYNNPEQSRILALKGARLLVNPTGRGDLPRARENLEAMTLVRAQENLVFAASANRVGDTHGSSWAGGSVIGGPEFPGFGRALARAGADEELIVATVDYADLARWHALMPWREWRLGPQGPATRLIARELSALADRVDDGYEAGSKP